MKPVINSVLAAIIFRDLRSRMGSAGFEDCPRRVDHAGGSDQVFIKTNPSNCRVRERFRRCFQHSYSIDVCNRASFDAFIPESLGRDHARGRAHLPTCRDTQRSSERREHVSTNHS